MDDSLAALQSLADQGREAAPDAGVALSYSQAKALKSSNPRSRWRDIVDDLSDEVWPCVSPSFRIQPGQTVFTIGSCFARNIEANLAALGCKVPMLDLRLPPEEFDGMPNAAMNRFHPPAFRQCLEWTAAIHDRGGQVAWQDCAPMAFEVSEGEYFDLDMASAVPVSRARFVERRQHIYDIFSTAFAADCIMMTPGLIEAWRDLETGLCTHGPPYHKRMLAMPDRWRFEVLSYSQCLEDLLAAIDVVRARNPAVKVLVTTSPVPMSTTFSGRDIAIANSHSKAVLRAVCDAVITLRDHTDYFPSYEMVTLSNPTLVWKSDRLHVSHAFIAKIVGYMLDHYMDGVDAASIHFQRARALLAEGDTLLAEMAARAALEAQPGHSEAKVLLSMALAGQRAWPEAQALLEPVVRAQPDRCDLRIQLARIMAGGGQIEAAESTLEAAMALPSFSITDLRAADPIMRRLPSAAAISLCRRGLELFPRHTEAYPPLIEALLTDGRKRDALEVLRRAAELPRPPPELQLQLAQLLAELGGNKEAYNLVRSIIAANPKYVEAKALRDTLVERLRVAFEAKTQ